MYPRFFISDTHFTAKMINNKLQLSVAGVSKIKVAPNSSTAYGDGSGELNRLISHLCYLEKQNYDISSILALLYRAFTYAGVPLKSRRGSLFHCANAVSSGLRAVFNGWDRWVVVTDTTPAQAFLVWFPNSGENPKARLDKCSLLWSMPGLNEWAVVVEGELTGCTKVGIAFTNVKLMSADTETVVIH
jgi:hypothetical protein